MRPLLVRTVALAAALLLCGSAAAQTEPAEGDAEQAPSPELAQIAQLNAEAKSAFISYSFRSAAKKLDEALTLARDKGLAEDPALAETYMLQGVTAVAGSNDLYRGLHYFVTALRLNDKIAIPKELATPQLLQMFKNAQQALKAVGKPPTIKLGTVAAEKAEQSRREAQKTTKLGLVHTAVDAAKRGYPIPITAEPGIDVQASKLYLYYRSAGVVTYTKLSMAKKRGLFRAAIPADATRGRYVHYYIEAVDARGRPAASHGSSRGPNVVIINR